MEKSFDLGDLVTEPHDQISGWQPPYRRGGYLIALFPII